MTEVQIELVGNLQPLSGKGSRELNKILREKILPDVVEIITSDVADKSREYARGADIPPQSIEPEQARHPIGASDSEYASTGNLESSIGVSYSSKIRSIVEATAWYASLVEFGTGIFGPRKQRIEPGNVMVFPFRGKTIAAWSTKGQPPQPFMRGSIWYINDNLRDTLSKIQTRLRSKYK